MQLRRAFVRALAVLLIGSLTFAPIAVAAAGTMAVADGWAMSSDMAMDSGSAAMDEMPCHQGKSDTGKNCPYMAVCMALCCRRHGFRCGPRDTGCLRVPHVAAGACPARRHQFLPALSPPESLVPTPASAW
jgi:hypothetical protein